MEISQDKWELNVKNTERKTNPFWEREDMDDKKVETTQVSINR